MKHTGGFTTIELLLAMVIIAVLAAVMLPEFLGVKARANDAAVQTLANTALKATLAAEAYGGEHLGQSCTLANGEVVFSGNSLSDPITVSAPPQVTALSCTSFTDRVEVVLDYTGGTRPTFALRSAK